MHLRTLLLALCCCAALADVQRAPEREPAAHVTTHQDVLRTGESGPQPFLAGAGALVDGLGAVALASGPREAPGTRVRPPLPATLLRGDARAPREYVVTLRRARLAGLARFGGTSPPPAHA